MFKGKRESLPLIGTVQSQTAINFNVPKQSLNVSKLLPNLTIAQNFNLDKEIKQQIDLELKHKIKLQKST